LAWTWRLVATVDNEKCRWPKSSGRGDRGVRVATTSWRDVQKIIGSLKSRLNPPRAVASVGPTRVPGLGGVETKKRTELAGLFCDRLAERPASRLTLEWETVLAHAPGSTVLQRSANADLALSAPHLRTAPRDDETPFVPSVTSNALITLGSL